MAHLALSFLGPPEAALDGQPVEGFRSDKERALLAYLAVEAARPHPREALAGLLWPGQTQKLAFNNLSKALHRLRHALGDEDAASPYLIVAPKSIQFNPEAPSRLDVAEFEGLLAQEARTPREVGGAWYGLGSVLAALGKLDEAQAAYEQSVAIREEVGEPYLTMEAVAGLARVALARGQPAPALTHTERILQHLAQSDLGGADEPLRVYLTCYDVLQANGDDPRARQVLRTAHRLLQEQAAGITDEALRQSFLTNVPAHRQIAAELARLGLAGYFNTSGA